MATLQSGLSLLRGQIEHLGSRIEREIHPSEEAVRPTERPAVQARETDRSPSAPGVVGEDGGFICLIPATGSPIQVVHPMPRITTETTKCSETAGFDASASIKSVWDGVYDVIREETEDPPQRRQSSQAIL